MSDIEGELIWGTDGKLSWDLQLDAGEYTAQVGAISENNSDYVTWSGLKSFVVEYDPYPAYVYVNITAGTSNTLSKFSWAESKGANNYYLRIFNNTGTKEVISVWGTDGKLSWDLQLDSGEYTAQVGAISENNSDYVTWSGLKSFVVEATSIIGDINADGKFNISDVVILQKWLLAIPDAKLSDWKAADLCEDDRLNVFDLCLMKRMLIEQD